VLPGEKIESLIRSAPTLSGKARKLLEGIYWAKNLTLRHERDRLNTTLYLLTCFVHSSRCNHTVEVADNIAGMADWLGRIVADLEDLNRGRVPSRFAPKRRRTGRPARVMLAPRYAAVARAAEAVMAKAPTLEVRARKFLEGIYGANLLPPSVIEYERDRLVLTLYLLRYFAYSSGAIETANWLAHIVDELEDPNCGRGSSMFAPTPKGKNPPKNSEIWRGRALIASGIDLLMGSGMSRKDIKNKLKHRTGKFGDLRVFVDDRDQRSAETLSKVLSDLAVGWREGLMNDKVQNPQAVAIWNGRYHKVAADGHNKEAVAYEFFERALAEARKVKPGDAAVSAGQRPVNSLKTPR
jgi:hypothetical protein